MSTIARAVPAFLLSAALTLPGFGQELVRVQKLPDATLLELAAAPAPPPIPRETRHDGPRRLAGPRALAVENAGVDRKAALATGATIAPPPVVSGFDSDNSRNLWPADASGAAGRAHVVSASNGGIVVHKRNGELLAKLSLSQFWRNTVTVAEFYDPRMVYDAAADRWITVAVRKAAQIVIAVTAGGDPTGTWYRYELDASGCDFTRIALTRDTVMVSTYLDYDSVLYSFPKAALYAGATPVEVRQYAIGYDNTPVDAPDSPVEYLVDVDDRSLRFARVDDMNSWTSIDAGFSWFIPFEDRAPQLGTTNTLDLGYGDIQSAVYRGGFLYAIHRIGYSESTKDSNALVWWKVDVAGIRKSTVGLLNSPTGTWYAYPSLNVNRDGDMLITYCTLSKNVYPSAAYVFRDAAGRLSSEGTIRAGNSAILRDRWGDYTTVAVDPLNDRTFWAMQIYALDGVWQTRWAEIAPAVGRRRTVRR